MATTTRSSSVFSVPMETVLYASFLLVTSLVPVTWGCFPMDDVFKLTPLWLQPTSLQSRHYWVIEDDHSLQVTTEGEGRARKIEVMCLESYSEHRMKVMVKEVYESIKYQCWKFTALTPQVVRLARTEVRLDKEKVNCDVDRFTHDEHVLISYHDIGPQPCPLTGGYQLIMHQGMVIKGDCQDTVQTYNPRIQFECDGESSGRAVLEFGPECEPKSLTRSQSMRGRHVTNLECVSSWEETGGHSSVLLKMANQDYTFFCLHYKKAPRMGSVVTVVSEDEEIFSMFLTVDARCSGEAFVNEDVPRNTSLFGFMASYRPEDDFKCVEQTYTQNCEISRGIQCFETTECPAICHRCKKPIKMEDCKFPANTHGLWKRSVYSNDLEITVEAGKIKSPSFGEFECRGHAEDDIYPLVQKGVASTCMPFYTCSKIFSSAPGLLDFNMRTAVRDSRSGEPYSCPATYRKVGHIFPVLLETTVTLIDEDQLQKTECNILHASTFPTILGECRIRVEECSGECHTLRADYDDETCGNDSTRAFAVSTEHTCYASINFHDSVRGIITKSISNNRYSCWLFASTRLFVASPRHCNQESVSRIFSQEQAEVTYDPLNAISEPVSGNSFGTSQHLEASRLSKLLPVMLVLLWSSCFYLFQHL